MKLLIVTQNADKNDENTGAFYYWFEAFAKKFDEVAIITGRKGDTSFPGNVKVFSFGKGVERSKIMRVWKFWELFSRQYAVADLVFFHMIPEFVLAASPFLVSLRKPVFLWYAHGSVPWKLKVAERLADFIFTSSQSGFRLPSKKVFFTGQAINTDIFAPRSAKAPRARRDIRFVTVGRISPIKNYEIILRACKVLEDTWPREWTLSCVGGPLLSRDHDYFDFLRTLVKTLGIEKRVEFLGSRSFSEIPLLLPDYDVFLNVSKTGSLDKVVLEAMASGLSVITANDAYRSILSPPYFLEYVSPEFLAERMKMLSQESRPNEALREIVLQDHSLAKTMEKMSAIMLGSIKKQL